MEPRGESDANEPSTALKPAVTQVVHVARPTSPEPQIVSDEVRHRHQRSAWLYPTLNLSAGEFVISAVRRHPIGLVVPLTIGTLLIGAILAIVLNYDVFVEWLGIVGPFSELSYISIPALFLVVAIGLGMFVSHYVYTRNRFFLTNESVIQEIQVTLFSRKEQTVSLANIEDASYSQSNIIQQIFDFGDIRLSTEGDETTYSFSYVAHPKDHIARLNNAVEAFKNGRPVDGN